VVVLGVSTLYLPIHLVEISEIFTTCSQVNILQDPIVTCVKILVFVVEMAVLECFW